MKDRICIKGAFFETMVSAIDSRIAVFHIGTDNNYVSEKLFEILGLDNKQKNYYKQNPNMLVSFLESNSIENTQGSGDIVHFIGVVDSDNRYIIIHLFEAENEYFGFVMDKTVQVYKNVTILEEFSKLKKNSQTDGLTGLLNRSGFEDVVCRSLKLQPGKGILCIFDMDNFKLVNDTLGHPVGDKVLVMFADMLSEAFSKSAFVGRIGGDEFVVFIYEDMTYSKLSEILKTFGEKVKADFDKIYPDKHLSSSIGASFLGSGISDYVSLYRSADSALYRTKQNGKGSYTIV